MPRTSRHVSKDLGFERVCTLIENAMYALHYLNTMARQMQDLKLAMPKRNEKDNYKQIGTYEQEVKISPLLTAVNDIGDVAAGPGAPVLANLVNLGGDLELSDLVGLDDELREQTSRGVPSDVAMEGPGTRVLLGVELHDHVAVGADLLDVTTLGVGGVGDGSVPGQAVTLGEDIHVEAVKMHGVTESR